MTRELRVPLLDRSDPLDLAELHDYVHEAIADPTERRVTFEVLFDLATAMGIKSYGDLDDHLERLEPLGRRRLVDQARSNLGMESLADEKGHQVFEAANRALRMRPARDEHGRRFVGCAEPSCNAWPQNEQGLPVAVGDRVWWCPAHKDQAGPEDHLPPEPKYALDLATMSWRPIGAERERGLEEDRKFKEAARERTLAWHAEGERLRKLEEDYRATLKPPPGFGPQ
jgi:hypothetical protein